MFVHPDTSYTIDFPRGPLAVGGDYIHETATLKKGDMTLRILSPADCVRDRLAHFYHWGITRRSTPPSPLRPPTVRFINLDLLRSWSSREESLQEFAEFERRLAKANG